VHVHRSDFCLVLLFSLALSSSFQAALNVHEDRLPCLQKLEISARDVNYFGQVKLQAFFSYIAAFFRHLVRI